MQTAPARQPRVSPAAPRMRRAWVPAALLVGAVLLAGGVMLPPFAAGTLFPSRGGAPSAPHRIGAKPAPASAPVVITMANATAPDTDDKPAGPAETKYSDLPLAPEPANDPPRSSTSDTAPKATLPGATPASGTLATGIFGSRSEPEAGTAAGPAMELTVQPIPPLDAVLAAPEETHPAISPPPPRRESLPLQTDLLPAETPGPPPTSKPGPERHG